jgi:hypothetical protein
MDDPDAWSSNSSFGVPLCAALAEARACVWGTNCSGLVDAGDCYDDSADSAYVQQNDAAFAVVEASKVAVEPYPKLADPLPAFEVRA